MYDSGFLAVVSDRGWDGWWIQPLDTNVWRVVNKMKPRPT